MIFSLLFDVIILHFVIVLNQVCNIYNITYFRNITWCNNITFCNITTLYVVFFVNLRVFSRKSLHFLNFFTQNFKK